MTVQRFLENPFLLPNQQESWQAKAVFNPCVIKENTQRYRLLCRAQSALQQHLGITRSVATIGTASGTDGLHFNRLKQLIKPEENWERFGCEDPRVTQVGDRYYIFYTALSIYPFEARGIRVGVAITQDFHTLQEKHLVTPFNAKAMALFPEKVNGKFAVVLTANTDRPPAKIAIALFDRIEQIWSESYWEAWYASLDHSVVPLLRSSQDHLEVGAAPIKTSSGWLLIYSYIQNYFSPEKRVFGIEAVLLDEKNLYKVIGRTAQPLLVPAAAYELKGEIPNVIFPSGALLEGEQLIIYYGAADTTCCAATIAVNHLLNTIREKKEKIFFCSPCIAQGFQRYQGNPIITPRPEFSWEAKATFNPAAIYEQGKFHLIYRAMSHEDTSVFGYASSYDGVSIDERLSFPIYVPTESFEQKLRPGNSGCEDPRITKMDDRFYLFYTAFDGYTPRVAFTSIRIGDFLQKKWNWSTPIVITPPGIDDKDACLLSRKIRDKYVIFHRANNEIRINYVDSLIFSPHQHLEHGGYVIKPRKEYWDNRKFGIAAPPIETEHGWLLFFHRVSVPGNVYKIEALLLDRNNPERVIGETDATLIEPEMDYEKVNHVYNVVFPCGAVLLNNEVYLYYGGADQVVAVAKMCVDDLFKRLGI